MSTPKEIAPGAILDFVFPWGEDQGEGIYLEDDETIASLTVARSAGLTQPSGKPEPATAEESKSVLVWNEFPTQIGQRCWCDCTIVTSAGRRDTRRYDYVVAIRGEG